MNAILGRMHGFAAKAVIMSFFLVMTACIGCREGGKPSSSSAGDAKFQQLSENFLKGYLAWRPELSVSLGFHEYDGIPSDFSKESLGHELARLKSYDQMLNGFDTTSLSPGMLFDLRILHNGIKNEIFNFEEMESYTKNPMTYAGAVDVSIYIKRNFAPLEQRVRSILAIEKNVPVMLADARSNLADALPKPYVETAIQIANGAADFLGEDLLTALKDVKNDSLMAVFNPVNAKAIAEFKSFAAYLQKEKLPKAHNHYALGKEKYQKMLLYGEDISMPAEKILEIGLADLEREENAFTAAAKIIDPNKMPVEVYHDIQKEHPTAGNLIPDIKRNVDAIRQFVIDQDIITIPSQAHVLVEETPQFSRSTSTASMNSPGPFEQKATEAYYYITPVDPKWTAKQKEDWLSQFDKYTADIITIHEVYPGHYTNFLHMNASSATKIEKIFASYAFVEGWAHYTEKMMVDQGYGNTGDPIKAAKYRLAQSSEALLRLCRLCVSIKMHCNGMSVDEATKFFMDNWHNGEKPSRQEALRGTFDPSYLYYTLGKLQMLKLRKDYQEQEGSNFSLKKFHDQVLENGMPPIQLLREKYLKNKNIWGDIL